MTRQLAADGGTPAFPEGLPLVRPTFDDVDRVVTELRDALETGQLTNGPRVAELEERLSQRLGVHVVAVGSCTAGLMLVYQALRVRGDVVMPSHTFSASAHAVAWAGGRPRFADVEDSRATLDPKSVRERLDGAAAISATHLYGHPAEVEDLEAIAAEAGIPLVFDSAHALGSMRGDRPIGSCGTAEVFSMSPTKVTPAGEGGIVATRDESLAEHVRLGRNYGNPGDYNFTFSGLSARMSELHATLALSSVRSLDRRLEARLEAVDQFAAELAGHAALRVVRPAAQDLSTFKDLTLDVDPDVIAADRLQALLRAEGVDSRRYFWPPLHRQDVYRGLSRADELPGTERVARRLLTVPLTNGQTAEVTRRLAAVIIELIGDPSRGDPSAPRK